jgi:hypothetical protein
MKHILPILTITTLAAAASAQSAAASSGLSYNQVSVSYLKQSLQGVSGSTNGYALQASALIGNSNVLVAAQTTIGGDIGNGGDQAYLGYVFKNAGGFADVLALVGSDETYGIRVRKDLGNNFEVGAQYLEGGVYGNSEYGIQLGYSISKQVSIDLGYILSKDAVGSADATQWSLGLRYNF